MDKQKAADAIDHAAFKQSLGYHGKQARLTRMGFDVVSDEEQAKHKALQHPHFSKHEGKPLGEIPMPKKVIQPEVDREHAKSMIDHHDKLPPIKVAKINGEHVVVDGHHRLAVAKALGKTKIHASLVESVGEAEHTPIMSFKEYIAEEYLVERVLSIGLNLDHDKFREQHRQEIHDMIHKAYSHPDLGGYGGHTSGSREESKAIHDDISSSVIKATKRDGKITAVNLYKKQHGRKSIASATDGSDQGKKDFMKTKIEDHEMKRAWGEVSGKVTHIHKKIGTPDIPASRAKELLNKDVTPHDDNIHYDRKIGGSVHTKKMVGHPKIG